jgi:hypothetical protein
MILLLFAEQQNWEDIASTNALIHNTRASESRWRMNERSMLSGNPSGGLAPYIEILQLNLYPLGVHATPYTRRNVSKLNIIFES